MNLQEMFKNLDVQKYVDMAISGVLSYAPVVIWALLTLWIGFKIVKAIVNALEKVLIKAKVDEALSKFVSSLLSAVLKVLVLLTVAWMVGIQTTSFIAILGAAGLAIGMALSGTLQNFAGGVMILLFKPFKVGDFVEVAGYAGVVDQIHIFNTYLLTGDKKTIIIPNSDISGSSLVNYSAQPKRRVDLVIWVSYDDDIDKVKATLNEIANSDERIIKEDGITVALADLWDSSVNFNFRFFVNSADYWAVRSDILEKVKKTFDEKGINFPYPTQEVYVHNVK